MPEVYAKKVPREECKEVPGVACHLVLEQVETPKCYPVPVEECDDILKEIPYLVEDEECNQVPRLDCNVVSRAHPQYPNISHQNCGHHHIKETLIAEGINVMCVVT